MKQEKSLQFKRMPYIKTSVPGQENAHSALETSPHLGEKYK